MIILVILSIFQESLETVMYVALYLRHIFRSVSWCGLLYRVDFLKEGKSMAWNILCDYCQSMWYSNQVHARLQNILLDQSKVILFLEFPQNFIARIIFCFCICRFETDSIFRCNEDIEPCNIHYASWVLLDAVRVLGCGWSGPRTLRKYKLFH